MIEVTCNHHQAIDRLGEGLIASSFDNNGIIHSSEFCKISNKRK